MSKVMDGISLWVTVDHLRGCGRCADLMCVQYLVLCMFACKCVRVLSLISGISGHL